MANKYTSAYIESQKPLNQVVDDAMQIFRSTGGIIFVGPGWVQVANGKVGTSMGFTANLNAKILINQIAPGKYEAQVFLSWNWGTFMWTMLILGFFTGITFWLLFFYLGFDPLPVYQQMLYRLVSFEKLS